MNKKVAYVIGSKVSKSLSPNIFDYWFKKYNINATYSYREINETNFTKDVEKILLEDNLSGINITIPYKEKIINYTSSNDEHSKLIGAINFITKTQNSFTGGNTDWIGFKESIKWAEKNGIEKLEEKNTAIVVGYGGSAKAIIYSLSYMGFKNIRVFNRTYEKISKLDRVTPHKLDELEYYFKDADLVVNTIPINYKKDIELNLPSQPHTQKKSSFGIGFDVVYNQKTFFNSYFPKNRFINGLPMLVHQAIPCFEKWFGVKPELDAPLYSLLISEVNKVLDEK